VSNKLKWDAFGLKYEALTGFHPQERHEKTYEPDKYCSISDWSPAGPLLYRRGQTPNDKISIYIVNMNFSKLRTVIGIMKIFCSKSAGHI
jgi:hypothetical protein